MNRHKTRNEAWWVCPRRGFLGVMLGLLGSLAIPVWAKRKKGVGHSLLREAAFYRPKKETERN